jgi:hypothetical protein
MGGFDSGGQRGNEVPARQGVFGIAPVYCIAGEDRVVAQVLHPSVAVGAVAIDSAQPGDTDPRANRQLGVRAFHHFADDLVPGNEIGPQRGQFTVDDVQVGPANSAPQNAQQHVPGLQLRSGNLFDLQGLARNSVFRFKYGGFHVFVGSYTWLTTLSNRVAVQSRRSIGDLAL